MDVLDRIPRFKACCIYVPLRTASIIIAWFSVIVACIYILVSVISLSSNFNRKLESEEHYRQATEESLDFYWWLVLLIGCVSLICGGLGIIGTHRNKLNCMKIFLIWKGISLTFEILVALVNTNILLVLMFAFRSYLWLIVFSYYKDLCEEKQHIAPTST